MITAKLVSHTDMMGHFLVIYPIVTQEHKREKRTKINPEPEQVVTEFEDEDYRVSHSVFVREKGKPAGEQVEWAEWDDEEDDYVVTDVVTLH